MIFVAIPAYDGRICAETAKSLLREQYQAAAEGLLIEVALLSGCSLITQARNQLCRDFYESDCDRLVFIDSDVAWEPGALVRLAKHPVDVVGGAYRYKADEESYPVEWLDRPELRADPATGLLEVASLPGGFLSISRAALDRLSDAYPQQAYTYKGHGYHGYFHAPIRGGGLWGEDAAFCVDWRNCGGQVWLDPELKLTHVGGHRRFEGCIGDWLRSLI